MENKEKDYVRKMVDLVEDLNKFISDEMSFPNYKGGKFNIIIEQLDEYAAVTLYFEEMKDKLFILRRHTKNTEANSLSVFYSTVYHSIMKYVFLHEDSLGNLKDEVTELPIVSLGFKTIYTSGLDKYRHYVQSILNK